MDYQDLASLKNGEQVTSVERISTADFWLRCTFDDSPLHIRGGITEWKCKKLWSLETLCARYSAVRVKLAKARVGVFDHNITGAVKHEYVSFHQAIESILQSSASGREYSYIQQHSIAETFPGLSEDLERPIWLDRLKTIYSTNLWLGSAGCFSPLHFDSLNNFLVQVSGRKQVILFDKRESACLYPSVGKKLEHCSRVNLLNPDHESFPMFKRAKSYVVTLEPGDLLYIPRRWWHAVYSVDTSISINFWWGGIAHLLRSALRLAGTPVGRQEIMAYLQSRKRS